MTLEQVAPNTFITELILKSKEDFSSDERIGQIGFIVYLVPLPDNRTNIISHLGPYQQLLTVDSDDYHSSTTNDIRTKQAYLERAIASISRIAHQYKDQSERLGVDNAKIPKVLFVSNDLSHAKLVSLAYLSKYKVDHVESGEMERMLRSVDPNNEMKQFISGLSTE